MGKGGLRITLNINVNKIEALEATVEHDSHRTKLKIMVVKRKATC